MISWHYNFTMLTLLCYHDNIHFYVYYVVIMLPFQLYNFIMVTSSYYHNILFLLLFCEHFIILLGSYQASMITLSRCNNNFTMLSYNIAIPLLCYHGKIIL
jgi:hypothetical protein